MTARDAIADALTALVAPDGLVPSDETVAEFEAHLRLLGFAVVPLAAHGSTGANANAQAPISETEGRR